MESFYKLKSPFLLSIVIALVLPSLAYTAQNEENKKQVNLRNYRVIIVTYKSHEVLDAVVNATIKGLVEIGNMPRNNIEVFNPNGRLDEIQSYVRGLNSQTTNLIISVSTPASQAVLSSRHPNIPVLYSFVSDPAALKLNDKANQKLNVTGISNILDYKNGFSLLKNIIPNLKKIGVIYNPSESNSAFSFDQILSQAKNQKPLVEVISRQFSNPSEIQALASALPVVQAIYVGGDNTLVQNIPLLISVMNNRRIPVFASDEGSVRNGAVAAYSIGYSTFGEKTAELALEVLRQGNADKIPSIKYIEGRCVINTGALKKMGLSTTNIGYKCVEIK